MGKPNHQERCGRFMFLFFLLVSFTLAILLFLAHSKNEAMLNVYRKWFSKSNAEHPIDFIPEPPKQYMSPSDAKYLDQSRVYKSPVSMLNNPMHAGDFGRPNALFDSFFPIQNRQSSQFLFIRPSHLKQIQTAPAPPFAPPAPFLHPEPMPIGSNMNRQNVPPFIRYLTIRIVVDKKNATEEKPEITKKTVRVPFTKATTTFAPLFNLNYVRPKDASRSVAHGHSSNAKVRTTESDYVPKSKSETVTHSSRSKSNKTPSSASKSHTEASNDD
jgi:hypothetical protein